MNEVPANLRRQIVQRANNRCEYCRLSQEGQEAAFHVDHIRPSIAGGATHIDNLALACVSCSLRKGARQTGFDLENDNEATIFHPRIENWHAHLRWDGEALIGYHLDRTRYDFRTKYEPPVNSRYPARRSSPSPPSLVDKTLRFAVSIE